MQGEEEMDAMTILGIFFIVIILPLAICMICGISCAYNCQCCSCICKGDDLLPTISDIVVNVPENPVGVTENPAAHRTQLQQDSIRSPSVSTQPPGNPHRVAHFNLTTPREETTETTRGIITSGPPRYPYSAAEVASWESPDISPPQDAPPPSYDDLFESSTYDLILN